jgi:signal transduction histidine kinase
MQALDGVNDGECHAEYRSIHPRDGSEHWVAARGQAFFDAEGKPIRFIGMAMDNTERKRTEEFSNRLNVKLEQRIAERTADLERMNQTLKAEIQGLKKTDDALRTSENLARGQLEALTSTLTALSKESEPEKFLEHVLRAIGKGLGAHSLGVWEMNESIGGVDLVAVFEQDHLHLATPEEIKAVRAIGPAPRNHPVWTEFFARGEHCVFGEIQADSVRVRLADGPDTPWYDWFAEEVANPLLPVMAKRLSALGIVATICVPMFVAGKVTGLISVRFVQHEPPLGPGEIELARALAHQAMLAIRLMRMSQQSRQAAVVAERNRMAREIHDTLAQGLTGVIVQLEAAEDALVHNLEKAAGTHIERAGELVRESLQEARRSVHALRPLVLATNNLCAAIKQLIEKMTAGTNLATQFTLPKLLSKP